jgi:hypothetical protein
MTIQKGDFFEVETSGLFPLVKTYLCEGVLKSGVIAATLVSCRLKIQANIPVNTENLTKHIFIHPNDLTK